MTGDYSAATKMIMKANPDHSAGLMDFKVKEMRERGMVMGGDAAKLGVGAMTDARWKDFFDTMVKAASINPRSITRRPIPCNSPIKGIGVEK